MLNDRHLQEAVLAELNWEPSVTAAHVGVTAKGGVVTLTGHVDSFAEKHAVETAACRVKGVKAVAEEIEVKLPFGTERSDDQIAAAAVDRLLWDVSVPSDAIRVQVEKGWLTLTGQVEWRYQRQAAEQNVRRLSGVIGVTNHITIKPRVNVQNISDNITHALHRSWFFDPKTITVSAEAGKVHLAGTVRSPHERSLAATTAWGTQGVTDVRNDLVVV